ncbi:Swi3-domain-containing protein [Thozetella sp. PMI_491]|nr:Swi3-domain-containing protein [Thozetella sp. PMI_491]
MDSTEEFENPFRSPTPDPADSRKRARLDEPEGLGIDEEVSVQKRARVPRVKLDENRLLSEKGIPKLRAKARDLRLKGKGHEFSDAARLISFYQIWLDDLFPKAKFLDALAMVEKAGHKTSMHKMRMEWINEGKPKSSVDNEDNGEDLEPSAPSEPTTMAPVFEMAARTKTPAPRDDDLFGDDIYSATPQKKTGNTSNEDVPEDDDLDALMAEAEAGPGAGKMAPPPAVKPYRSLFGDGGQKKTAQPSGEPDDDDLDALLAEAEADSAPQPTRQSIFGGGKVRTAAKEASEAGDGMDDLDALLAEAEAGLSEPKRGEQPPPSKEGETVPVDDDEEAAMAEMGGLW